MRPQRDTGKRQAVAAEEKAAAATDDEATPESTAAATAAATAAVAKVVARVVAQVAAWGEEGRGEEAPVAVRVAVVWGRCQAGMAGQRAEVEP